jgi:hypothetical protein
VTPLTCIVISVRSRKRTEARADLSRQQAKVHDTHAAGQQEFPEETSVHGARIQGAGSRES